MPKRPIQSLADRKAILEVVADVEQDPASGRCLDGFDEGLDFSNHCVVLWPAGTVPGQLKIESRSELAVGNRSEEARGLLRAGPAEGEEVVGAPSMPASAAPAQFAANC